jgi:hypothetical protein
VFQSTKEDLSKLLDAVADHSLQLPDFQRDWVWDEQAIKELLVSILRQFPVGAVLTLEAGGEVKFMPRPLSHAGEKSREPDEFLLDGQQRLTSLFQSLKSGQPVRTRTVKGAKVERLFFVDLVAASSAHSDPMDWIVSVPGNGIETSNFGRDIVRDLSTRETQFDAHMFPLNQVYSHYDWHLGYGNHWQNQGISNFETNQALIERVLKPVQSYEMPIIRLDKSTSREAVCTVFEKVNTGGKKLDAFELVTAIYAADEFNLRHDWMGDSTKPGRRDRMRGDEKSNSVLANLQSTDFLQACTALSTMDARAAAEARGLKGKDLPPVSIRREAMLALPLSEYQRLADSLEDGFIAAQKFLSARKIIWHKDVPYPTQLITLAAVFARLPYAERTATADAKLDHWLWSGVFGELYSGSVETRIARDVPELLDWIRRDAASPATIGDAIFQADRLESLRSRLAAAYKGVHARLMVHGARDFISGNPFEIMTYFGDQVDIHHIFPRDWCLKQGIEPKVFDSIINKTPLSRLSNIRIGGDAPSVYLQRIEDKDGIPRETLDDILRSHLIEPSHLRRDDFDAFYDDRRIKLAELIGEAMRKDVVMNVPAQSKEEYDELEDIEAEA